VVGNLVDIASFLMGAVAGFVVGALVFTVTGKEVTAEVTRAGAKRVAYWVEPKR